MNPYEVLGVSPAGGTDEIEAAYHRLVKRYHPDGYAHGDQRVRLEAEARMAEVTEAMAAVRADLAERDPDSERWAGRADRSDRDAATLEDERLARLTALVGGEHDPALIDVVAGASGRQAAGRREAGSEPPLSRTRLALQVALVVSALIFLIVLGRLVLS